MKKLKHRDFFKVMLLVLGQKNAWQESDDLLTTDEWQK
jgi:hypothetical protein